MTTPARKRAPARSGGVSVSHRKTDTVPDERLTINRTIPLWGLVCALGLFAAQAASLYYGQVSQGEKLVAVQASIAGLVAKLDVVVASQNAAALKDLEHDMKITGLTNRIQAIEGVMQRQVPGPLSSSRH